MPQLLREPLHTIALATYRGAPDLAPDDRLLVPALGALGIGAQPVVWSDPEVEWTRFDAIVIRSCWDYHLRFGEFDAWLRRLVAAQVRVMNSPALVRWNADKRYLIDLLARGIATIPTIIISTGRPADVAAAAAREGWDHVVIKPAISASGYETYALRAPFDRASRATIANVTSVGDILIQPFAIEVTRDGEHSFTFIDGQFSHAAIKRARRGAFLVQTEHGGSVAAIAASPAIVAQASRVLDVLEETPIYARVDGIVRGEKFMLMELELIEPNLFLSCAPGSAQRLARAIAARISRAIE